MSLIAWALLALHYALPSLGGTLLVRETWVMGTRARVTVEAPSRGEAAALGELAIREMERVDGMLSTWDESARLAEINGTPPGVPTQLGTELSSLLVEVDDWARRTGGAFEPRIGALIDAWDVRGAGRTPDALQIQSALESSGTQAIRIHAGTLTRMDAAAWLESGGFGKGAALRSVAGLLGGFDHGAKRMLVDLGGQLLAEATPDRPWEVDVAHPLDRSIVAARLSVSRGSVATSGTSERGRHILDPRTGRPAPTWGSVTVVHADPLVADVLSTALFVMGPDTGLQWAEDAGIGALFLVAEGPALRLVATSYVAATLPTTP